MSITAAVAMIETLVNQKIGSVTPFSATVDSLSGGKVAIKRLGAVNAESQLYARLAGFKLAVNDEVICLNYLGNAFVLGKVQRSAASMIDLNGGSDGQYLMRLAGALDFGSFQNLHFRIANRGSSSGNVTSTSYGTMSSLQTTITLENGITFDVFSLGTINAQAAAGQTLNMAVSLDGTVDTASEAVTATTTSVGLGFGGLATIVGDGTSKTFAAANKVSGGTGVLREGILLVIAIARN